jgi:hypothetical protein
VIAGNYAASFTLVIYPCPGRTPRELVVSAELLLDRQDRGDLEGLPTSSATSSLE